MRKKYTSVNEYINDFPPEQQEKMRKLQKMFINLDSEIDESISYNIPGYKIQGKPVIYFAAFKNHISIYPIISGVKEIEKELSKYRSGKGTMKFPTDKEIPYALVKQVAEYRLKEALNK